MTKKTHSSGGVLFALIAFNQLMNIYLVNYNSIYKLILIGIFFYFSYLGSLFPDIDIKSSFISKRYPILYKYIGKKFKHRGFTHSLLAVIILYKFCELLIKYGQCNIVFICVSAGFLLGYSSHLFLDAFTKEGICLLSPLKINLKILSIKTNSKPEKYFNKFLKVLIMLMIIYNFYPLIN